VPLRGDGQIVAAVATVHDLTGVRAAERDREQFLSIVSHELRTPLTPLKAIAQLIRSRVRRSVAGRSPMDFESLEKNLAAIERQVDRMNGLVSDLVSVSQAQRGALQMEPTSFDLAALVREVVQRYVVSTADDGRYAFRVEAPEALPATGDQARIDQLLMNLIGNAVKYSPSGGQIDLQVKPHVGGVEITIQDKGIGIPREDLLGLGQPFARGTGRAATFAGMGVGLYVARLVAEGHGGGLEIASDGTEKGTTVRVRLVL
jgi:signal transduction histidine kinase